MKTRLMPKVIVPFKDGLIEENQESTLSIIRTVI